MLYPPLNFTYRDRVALPIGFEDAEFYQPEIEAFLYVNEDPDDRDFGWLGWQLPQYDDSPCEVSLEQVLLMVDPADREHVVVRTLKACVYADGHADEHPDPERVRALAAYYRATLERYREAGADGFADPPLAPPV
jgi:hypothetical protein